jgi:hypothetical protein
MMPAVSSSDRIISRLKSGALPAQELLNRY